MTNTKNIIMIDTEKDDNPYSDPNGVYKTDHVLLVEGSNNPSGWGLGGWVRGFTNLTETNGEQDGPHGYAFGLAAVICDTPGMNSGAVNARKLENGTAHKVAAGDRISMAGTIFEITVCPRGFVNLTPISDDVELRVDTVPTADFGPNVRVSRIHSTGSAFATAEMDKNPDDDALVAALPDDRFSVMSTGANVSIHLTREQAARLVATLATELAARR